MTAAGDTPTTEAVDVVDDDDRVIATKARTALIDGIDRWRMVVVLVVDDTGAVLLAQRADDKAHDPGLWTAAVCGTVQAGDTYLETAVRETGEEIGLHIDGSDLDEVFRGRWDRPGQLRCAAVYLLRRTVAVADLDWDRREAQALDWFDLDDARAQIASEPHRFTSRADEILDLLTAT